MSDRDGLVEATLALPRLPGADSAVLCEARLGGARTELRQGVGKRAASAVPEA